MLLGKHMRIYFVWCSSRQQVRDICAVRISVKAVQSSGAGANPCLLVAVLKCGGCQSIEKTSVSSSASQANTVMT